MSAAVSHIEPAVACQSRCRHRCGARAARSPAHAGDVSQPLRRVGRRDVHLPQTGRRGHARDSSWPAMEEPHSASASSQPDLRRERRRRCTAGCGGTAAGGSRQPTPLTCTAPLARLDTRATASPATARALCRAWLHVLIRLARDGHGGFAKCGFNDAEPGARRGGYPAWRRPQIELVTAAPSQHSSPRGHFGVEHVSRVMKVARGGPEAVADLPMLHTAVSFETASYDVVQPPAGAHAASRCVRPPAIRREGLSPSPSNAPLINVLSRADQRNSAAAGWVPSVILA